MPVKAPVPFDCYNFHGYNSAVVCSLLCSFKLISGAGMTNAGDASIYSGTPLLPTHNYHIMILLAEPECELSILVLILLVSATNH